MEQNRVVSFSPAERHIAEIKQWLIAERDKSGEGFYCNWSVIQSMFENNQVAIIFGGQHVVGFATWRLTTDLTARIDITEVKPGYRKKGFGRELINELIFFLKNKGVLIIDLQCAPASSERVWKRLGFNEYPAPPENYMFGSDENKRLYLILTEQLNQSNTVFEGEKIELWIDEPYMASDSAPVNTWNILFKPGTRELVTPIIYPAHYEWRIRWSANGKVIKDDKIKYFGADIDFSTFIIIKELIIK